MSGRKILPDGLFFVVYFIREEIHHKAETVTGKRILCHAVQLGICFENMQQRIHGLLCHDAVLRELFIALRLEIAGKCLEITVLVGAVCLDDLLQRFASSSASVSPVASKYVDSA